MACAECMRLYGMRLYGMRRYGMRRWHAPMACADGMRRWHARPWRAPMACAMPHVCLTYASRMHSPGVVSDRRTMRASTTRYCVLASRGPVYPYARAPVPVPVCQCSSPRARTRTRRCTWPSLCHPQPPSCAGACPCQCHFHTPHAIHAHAHAQETCNTRTCTGAWPCQWHFHTPQTRPYAQRRYAQEGTHAHAHAHTQRRYPQEKRIHPPRGTRHVAMDRKRGGHGRRPLDSLVAC